MDSLAKLNNAEQLINITKCDSNKARKRSKVQTKREKAKRAR